MGATDAWELSPARTTWHAVPADAGPGLTLQHVSRGVLDADGRWWIGSDGSNLVRDADGWHLVERDGDRPLAYGRVGDVLVSYPS